jgi:hypothetical protein
MPYRALRTAPMGSGFMLVVFIVCVILTARVALRAMTFIIAFVATPFPALLAMFLAAAMPNRISQQIKSLNGGRRVVALDHQLTTS